jgi:hypothetical protein
MTTPAHKLLSYLEGMLGAPEEQKMSETTITVEVGADVGNATTIVAVRPAGGKVTTRCFPTAAAFDISLPPKLSGDDYVFYTKHGTVDEAIGMAALRYADGEAVTARGSSDRYGAFQARFLDAGILAQTKAERVVVKQLGITVPAKFHSPELVERVRRALAGTRVRYEQRRARTIEVQRVAVFREGEAALAHVRHLAKGPTILIDGGGGQSHVAIARDGQLVRDPVTRETGQQRVIDKADDEIRARFGRRLTALERYEVEQAVATKQPYAITVDGQDVRIDAIVREQFAHTAPLIIADVQALVPKWRNAQTILFGGGQALHLEAEYRAAFPRLVVVKRPAEWNALGALALVSGAAAGDVEVAA